MGWSNSAVRFGFTQLVALLVCLGPVWVSGQPCSVSPSLTSLQTFHANLSMGYISCDGVSVTTPLPDGSYCSVGCIPGLYETSHTNGAYQCVGGNWTGVGSDCSILSPVQQLNPVYPQPTRISHGLRVGSISAFTTDSDTGHAFAAGVNDTDGNYVVVEFALGPGVDFVKDTNITFFNIWQMGPVPISWFHYHIPTTQLYGFDGNGQNIYQFDRQHGNYTIYVNTNTLGTLYYAAPNISLSLSSSSISITSFAFDANGVLFFAIGGYSWISGTPLVPLIAVYLPPTLGQNGTVIPMVGTEVLYMAVYGLNSINVEGFKAYTMQFAHGQLFLFDSQSDYFVYKTRLPYSAFVNASDLITNQLIGIERTDWINVFITGYVDEETGTLFMVGGETNQVMQYTPIGSTYPSRHIPICMENQDVIQLVGQTQSVGQGHLSLGLDKTVTPARLYTNQHNDLFYFEVKLSQPLPQYALGCFTEPVPPGPYAPIPPTDLILPFQTDATIPPNDLMIEAQFSALGPAYIAGDNQGRVWGANRANKSIYQYSFGASYNGNDTSPQRIFNLNDTSATFVSFLLYRPDDGRVYGLTNNGNIFWFSPTDESTNDTTQLYSFSDIGYSLSHFTFDANGLIFGTATNNLIVLQLDGNDTLIVHDMKFDSSGSTQTQFVQGNGFSSSQTLSDPCFSHGRLYLRASISSYLLRTLFEYSAFVSDADFVSNPFVPVVTGDWDAETIGYTIEPMTGNLFVSFAAFYWMGIGPVGSSGATVVAQYQRIGDAYLENPWDSPCLIESTKPISWAGNGQLIDTPLVLDLSASPPRLYRYDQGAYQLKYTTIEIQSALPALALGCPQKCSVAPLVMMGEDATLGFSPCASAKYPLAHGSECSSGCGSGYIGAVANYSCVFGEWSQGPTCSLLNCTSDPSISAMGQDGTLGSYPCATQTYPLVNGSQCTTGCAKGYAGAPTDYVCYNGSWIQGPNCTVLPQLSSSSSSTGGVSGISSSSSSGVIVTNYTNGYVPPVIVTTPPVVDGTCVGDNNPCLNGGICQPGSSQTTNTTSNTTSPLCTCSSAFRGPFCQFGILACLDCIVPPAPTNLTAPHTYSNITLVGLGFDRLLDIQIGDSYTIRPDQFVQFQHVDYTNQLVQSALNQPDSVWDDSLSEPGHIFYIVRLTIDIRAIKNSTVTQAVTQPELLWSHLPTVTTQSSPISPSAHHHIHHHDHRNLATTSQAIANSRYIPVIFNLLYTAPEPETYDVLLYQSYYSTCLNSGEWRPDPNNGNVCLSCPIGGRCPGGGLVYPLIGYWSDNEFSAPVKCGLGDIQCPGTPISLSSKDVDSSGGHVNTQVCNPGYVGTACATCDSNYYQSDRQCLPCNSYESEAAQFAGLMVFGFCVLMFLSLMVAIASSESLAKLVGLFVLLQQAIATGKSSSQTWPKSLKRLSDLLNTLGIINFDLTFLKPGCIAPTYSFFDTFYGTILFAVLAWFMFSTACWCRKRFLLTRIPHPLSELTEDELYGRANQTQPADVESQQMYRSKRKEIELGYSRRIRHATLILGSLFYLKLTTLELNGLDCHSIPRSTALVTNIDPSLIDPSDMIYVLVSDPTIHCWSGTHAGTAVIIFFLLLVFSAGFPLYCLSLLTKAFAPILLNQPLHAHSWISQLLIKAGYQRESGSAPPSTMSSKIEPHPPTDSSSTVTVAITRGMKPQMDLHHIHMELFGFLFRGLKDERYFFRILTFLISLGFTFTLAFVTDLVPRTFIFGILYIINTLAHCLLLPFIEQRSNLIGSIVQLVTLLYTIGVLALMKGTLVHTYTMVLGIIGLGACIIFGISVGLGRKVQASDVKQQLNENSDSNGDEASAENQIQMSPVKSSKVAFGPIPEPASPSNLHATANPHTTRDTTYELAGPSSPSAAATDCAPPQPQPQKPSPSPRSRSSNHAPHSSHPSVHAVGASIDISPAVDEVHWQPAVGVAGDLIIQDVAVAN